MKAIIAAVDQDWGIGKEGKIPWYYKEDFNWFKTHTKNAVVIMGYNTFAELAEKFNYYTTHRLLPGRVSYVISRKSIMDSPTVHTGYTDIQKAVAHAQANYPDKDIFFIGGERIFKEALPLVERLYLTKIPAKYECDAFFPKDDVHNNNLIGTTSISYVDQDTSHELLFWIYKRYEV